MAYHLRPMWSRFQNWMPATTSGRWSFFGGLVLVVSGMGLAGAGALFGSVERVPLQETDAAQEAIDALDDSEAGALEGEFEALQPYGPITDERLLQLIAEAAAAGRLIDRADELQYGVSPARPDDDFETYLLIGSDETGVLADVLIYYIEPVDGSTPTIASIPRDLYVRSPCTNLNSRINANLNGCGDAVNGPTLVSIAVSRFTGFQVDHFVVLDFEGLRRIVDALGGVELCFDYPTRDRKAHLDVPAGCFVADGETTLAYARSRQTQQLRNDEWLPVGADDFSRQAQQREVLFKLLDKLSSFSSITAFADVATTLADRMQLDDRWTVTEAIDVVWDHRNLNADDVLTVVVEAEDYRTTGGAAVLVPTTSFASLYDEAQEASRAAAAKQSTIGGT